MIKTHQTYRPLFGCRKVYQHIVRHSTRISRFPCVEIVECQNFVRLIVVSCISKREHSCERPVRVPVNWTSSKLDTNCIVQTMKCIQHTSESGFDIPNRLGSVDL